MTHSGKSGSSVVRDISSMVNQSNVHVLTSVIGKNASRGPDSGESDYGEGSNPTVLIVHDDPDQSGLMSTLLWQSGYHTITAEDGFEGYELASANLPDLVISDVSMPRMDGIELCSLIRENPELKRTP